MTGRRRSYAELGLEPVQEHGPVTVAPAPGSYVVDLRTAARAIVRGSGSDGAWLHLRRPGELDGLPWTAQLGDVRQASPVEAAQMRALELAVPYDQS